MFRKEENRNAATDLETEDLHIWRYDLNERDYLKEMQNPVLSMHEKRRCEEFLHEADRLRYVCIHRFVRQVLSAYLNTSASEIEINYAKFGKPFINGNELYFSYTYRSNMALLAISRQSEIGIDIEKMRQLQDVNTFCEFSFSIEEREILDGCTEEAFQETLFTFWTFKEAVIKALGVGLNADLTQINLSPYFVDKTKPLRFKNDEIYTVSRLMAPEGYKAAYAMKGLTKRILEFSYDSKDM